VTTWVAADARVAHRDTDGRHAMSAPEVAIDVTIAPDPSPEDLGRLLARAERDCFIAASLAAAAHHRWTVNGVARPGPT